MVTSLSTSLVLLALYTYDTGVEPWQAAENYLQQTLPIERWSLDLAKHKHMEVQFETRKYSIE